jgi:hypothetical protein
LAAVTETGFVPMQVTKVTAVGQAVGDKVSFYVVLEELDGYQHLVISIGQEQALGLAATLNRHDWTRPTSYQFMAALVGALDGAIREVRLDRVLNGAYAATVIVAGPDGVAREVDARSSDALNLAVLLGTPVFAAPQVLADCAGRLAGDTPEAALARRALKTPPMTFVRKGG